MLKDTSKLGQEELDPTRSFFPDAYLKDEWWDSDWSISDDDGCAKDLKGKKKVTHPAVDTSSTSVVNWMKAKHAREKDSARRQQASCDH